MSERESELEVFDIDHGIYCCGKASLKCKRYRNCYLLPLWVADSLGFGGCGRECGCLRS